jgi:hypothetical protein
MNEDTRAYHLAQITKLDGPACVTSIKLMNEHGQTHFLALTDEQAIAIKDILTD